ncbi:gp75 protein [Mycobacteroides abscessus subsp. abscessus]|uniref:hypothetical protein n=1 Tax=Mycobacteroides abscessus TaxID=36809 RepID=UPI00092BDE6C|nr:hypothetical protein [Mycobacteroides abscessus]SIE44743.1 gp75 protein [Mycobacteroides abscessus subsp. abscessus]SKQ03677.1 bacteriophage protein [Mycobacteroides abscessus subsp. massiliense]SKV19514.1 gp75 protein [Mycobacteroides abscessus subsp. abscessus]SLD72386.1 gp75 protein [Mycobacteroides abscessus subsp. massiliense]
MTNCRKCSQPAQLFLCCKCVDALREHATQLAWLVERLDETVTRHDKLSSPTIGKSSDEPLPFNADASTLAHRARNTITTWVRSICEHRGIEFEPVRVVPLDFIGPLPDSRWRRLPRRYQPTPADMCEWLAEHAHAIALTPGAQECAADMAELCESVLKTLNRTTRQFAGPCPTVTGHNRRGEQITCGHMLYARDDESFVQCPACEANVDVQRNRLRVAVDRDLMTETKLVETLRAVEGGLDEDGNLQPAPSSRTVRRWIKRKQLFTRGWVHNGQIVSVWVRRGDPRVFSFSQAQHLWWTERAQGHRRADEHDPEDIPPTTKPSAHDSARYTRSHGITR